MGVDLESEGEKGNKNIFFAGKKLLSAGSVSFFHFQTPFSIFEVGCKKIYNSSFPHLNNKRSSIPTRKGKKNLWNDGQQLKQQRHYFPLEQGKRKPTSAAGGGGGRVATFSVGRGSTPNPKCSLRINKFKCRITNPSNFFLTKWAINALLSKKIYTV